MSAITKKTILIILGILLLGGIVLVAYLTKLDSSGSGSVSTPVGWETFTSESCKFSVDYPGDWIVQAKTDTSLTLVSPEDFAALEAAQAGGFIFEAYNFTAIVRCSLDLEDFATQSGYGDLKPGDTLETVLSANDQVSRKIVLDHFDAYEVIMGGIGAIDEIVINNKGRIYSFVFPDVDSMSKLSEEQRGILDSFRLTK